MTNDARTRVGILTNIPTPYRIPLFNRLAQSPLISLSVAFNAVTENNRHWKLSEKEFGFEHTFLKVNTLNLGVKDSYSIHFNHGVRNWIARSELDVVILGGWSQIAQIEALLYCRAKGIPVILWSGSIPGNPSFLRKVTRPFVKFLLKQCSAYVAYGSSARDYLAQLGAVPNAIFVGINAIDDKWWSLKNEDFDPIPYRRNLGLADETLFTYSGQLIERKGVEQLLRAFATVNRSWPNSRLVIAGSGPLESQLKSLAESLNLAGSVTFLGETSKKALRDLYTISDVTILPSEYEVWGLVVNESMSCGTPVILSSAAGAAEDLVVEGATGWIFNIKDKDDLGRKMVLAASLGRGALDQLGKAAALHMEQKATIDHSANGFIRAILAVERKA